MHDAVRPCVQVRDINALISAVVPSFLGGLLAVPITDTVKISNQDITVRQTMDRTMLWCAQTPQLFRFSVLYNALQAVVYDFESISDPNLEYMTKNLKFPRVKIGIHEIALYYGDFDQK